MCWPTGFIKNSPHNICTVIKMASAPYCSGGRYVVTALIEIRAITVDTRRPVLMMISSFLNPKIFDYCVDNSFRKKRCTERNSGCASEER